MASSSSELASPQLQTATRIRCMNLGQGNLAFATNKDTRKEYKLRFPKEVNAMLYGRDIACLTEVNTDWYKWLIEDYDFCGRDSKYRAVHDI